MTTSGTVAKISANPVGIQAPKHPQQPQKTLFQKIREDIQREKELKKLEEQYQNGEISKFEYMANKALLKADQMGEVLKPQPKYSTTA